MLSNIVMDIYSFEWLWKFKQNGFFTDMIWIPAPTILIGPKLVHYVHIRRLRLFLIIERNRVGIPNPSDDEVENTDTPILSPI